MALHHGMQMVADLGAAAVEVESDSTLALAALQQKEQDYCVFGLIYFMMARLRSNAIFHCACERHGRPTRLRIETLQSHSQHRRSSYSLTAPEEDYSNKSCSPPLTIWTNKFEILGSKHLALLESLPGEGPQQLGSLQLLCIIDCLAFLLEEDLPPLFLF